MGWGAMLFLPAPWSLVHLKNTRLCWDNCSLHAWKRHQKMNTLFEFFGWMVIPYEVFTWAIEKKCEIAQRTTLLLETTQWIQWNISVWLQLHNLRKECNKIYHFIYNFATFSMNAMKYIISFTTLQLNNEFNVSVHLQLCNLHNECNEIYQFT